MSGREFKFNLGDRLKDKITGFTGICVYRTQWINNCNVYGLQPESLEEKGAPRDRHQFDEPQLERLEVSVHQPYRETGGPNDSMSPTTV
jgi:hypothetical protein